MIQPRNRRTTAPPAMRKREPILIRPEHFPMLDRFAEILDEIAAERAAELLAAQAEAVAPHDPHEVPSVE